MKLLVLVSALVAVVHCQFTAEEQQIIDLLNSGADPSADDFENLFDGDDDFGFDPYSAGGGVPGPTPYNPYTRPPFNPYTPAPYNPYGGGQAYNQYGQPPQYNQYTTPRPYVTTGFATRPRTNYNCDVNCKDVNDFTCSIMGSNCRSSGIGKIVLMASICPASCGICRKCPVHALPCVADGSCKENTLVCLTGYARSCKARSKQGALARSLCPITCQICRPCEAPPTTTAATCSDTCEDKNKVDCPGWANRRNSYCHQSSKYQPHMIQNCALSCKFCFRCDATTTTPVAPPKPTTTYPVPPTGYPAPPTPPVPPKIIAEATTDNTTTETDDSFDPFVQAVPDFGEFSSNQKIDPDSFSEFFTEDTSPLFKEILKNFTKAKTCDRGIVVGATMQQQCLNAHNYYRCLHGASPLTYDGTLEKTAQLYARKMAFDGKSGFQSVRPSRFGVNRKPGVGENIAWRQSRNNKLSVNKAIAGWYAEGLVYNYNNPLQTQKQTEHFSQVVWKETSRVGCAIQQNRNEIYVVAHYFTIGNNPRTYSTNVMPLRSDICQTNCAGGYCNGNEGGVSKCSCQQNQAVCTGRCVAYCPKPRNYRGAWNMRCEGASECMCKRSRYVQPGQILGAVCV